MFGLLDCAFLFFVLGPVFGEWFLAGFAFEYAAGAPDGGDLVGRFHGEILAWFKCSSGGK